jgi:hypothetical protein
MPNAFYDLITDPAVKQGSMGKSNAEEMESWQLWMNFLAFSRRLSRINHGIVICVLKFLYGPVSEKVECLA